ncbi:MAG: DUF1653 domain-containing protein [Litoreibacter sp.]|nr:DUF1653 domain-containing protein [Litoreibacter sp.]
MSYLTNWIGGVFRRSVPEEPVADAQVANVPSNGWFATHAHRKGGRYRVIMHAVLEADRSEVVVYDDAEGCVWVRPVAEFYDGRFAALGEGNSAG